jgi:hypothetical protein
VGGWAKKQDGEKEGVVEKGCDLEEVREVAGNCSEGGGRMGVIKYFALSELYTNIEQGEFLTSVHLRVPPKVIQVFWPSLDAGLHPT